MPQDRKGLPARSGYHASYSAHTEAVRWCAVGEGGWSGASRPRIQQRDGRGRKQSAPRLQAVCGCQCGMRTRPCLRLVWWCRGASNRSTNMGRPPFMRPPPGTISETLHRAKSGGRELGPGCGSAERHSRWIAIEHGRRPCSQPASQPSTTCRRPPSIHAVHHPRRGTCVELLLASF